MAKVSMLEASKLFNVSRPTLLKHLKDGKISGERVQVDKNIFWKLDVAELGRVYERRDKPAPDLPQQLTNPDTQAAPLLEAEIRVLQAELKAAQEMIAEKDRRIDDLRRMLPGPDHQAQDAPARRRWWPF